MTLERAARNLQHRQNVNLPGISSTQCSDNVCTQNALKTRKNNADAMKEGAEAQRLEESLRERVSAPTETAGTRLNVQA